MPYINENNLKEKCSQWLEKIAPFNVHDFPLDLKNSALMIIDMQKFFLDPQSPTFTEGGPPIIPNLRKLIDAFKTNGRPVIYTRHVHRADGSDAGIMGWWWQGMCIEGTPESEIHDDIAPETDDITIFKHRYDSFYNTDLETILRGAGIDELVIGGIMTNMCCESTARGAYYRDIKVHFLADGTGSVTEEMHFASLLNLAFGFANITTTDKILSQIESKQQIKV